jgi:hypothetical protein
LIFDERTPPFDLFTGICPRERAQPEPLTMSDEHEHHHDHDHAHEHPRTRGGRGRRFAGVGRGAGQQFRDCQNRDGANGRRLFLFRLFHRSARQEKAVILRFGKPVGEGQKALLTAGLHWSLPYPIDEVVRIPISEIQQIVASNNGWYLTTPEAGIKRRGNARRRIAEPGD